MKKNGQFFSILFFLRSANIDLFSRIQRTFFSARSNTSGIRITRQRISSSTRLPARVPIPIQSRLHSKARGREGKGFERSGAEEPSISRWLCTCVPAYVIYQVSRIHKRNSHMRGDRVPQVSLGPHRHNTFTDVTLHSKLLRCRRTRISFSLPPSLP